MKEQLQSLRKSKGLTQEQISSIIDVKLSTYQKYERDATAPPYDVLLRIADFYGVTTDYLLGREPAPNPFADLNLSEDDEAEVISKYMSLPQEIRACMLDVLVQLGEAAKKRHTASMQPNSQSDPEQV
ncbi:MAG: helix-turn-helix domain-containing protein [Ruminococcus flavefaciens]|nr:helix-turn-helix domain-containing protein [Ruminococcus flavefaciens]